MAEKLQKLRYGQDVTSEFLNKLIDVVNQLNEEHKDAELNKKEALEKIQEFEAKFIELADQYSNTLARVPDFADLVKNYFSSYINTFSVTDEINETSPFAVAKNLSLFITDDITSFILNHSNLEKAIVFEFKTEIINEEAVYTNNVYVRYGGEWKALSGGSGSGSVTLPANFLQIDETDFKWIINGVKQDIPAAIQGPQGRQGIQGERGEKGEKGDTGIQGTRGPTGNPGKTLSVDIVFADNQYLNNASSVFRSSDKYMGIRFYYVDDPDSVNENISYKVIKITGDTYYPYFDGTYLRFTKNLQEAENFGQPMNIKGEQGERGPQGIQGEKGEKGDKGDKGDDGTSITIAGAVNTHSALPTASEHSGEGYIVSIDETHDNETGILYVSNGTSWSYCGKIQGPQGPQGPQGLGGTTPHIGENGNWWIGDESVPENDTGIKAKGDKGDTAPAYKLETNPSTYGNVVGTTDESYKQDDKLITSDGHILTYDETNGWTDTGISIRGKDGTNILSGSTAPSNSLGNNGDLYINTGTYMLYRKQSNTWSSLFSMKGADGSVPTVGSDGMWYAGGQSLGVRAIPRYIILLDNRQKITNGSISWPQGKSANFSATNLTDESFDYVFDLGRFDKEDDINILFCSSNSEYFAFHHTIPGSSLVPIKNRTLLQIDVDNATSGNSLGNKCYIQLFGSDSSSDVNYLRIAVPSPNDYKCLYIVHVKRGSN